MRPSLILDQPLNGHASQAFRARELVKRTHITGTNYGVAHWQARLVICPSPSPRTTSRKLGRSRHGRLRLFCFLCGNRKELGSKAAR
jgi:hypothetical protein